MKPFRKSSPQGLVGLLTLAILAAVLGGLGTYRYLRLTLETKAEEELAFLAQAQRDHFELWLQERLKDAEVTARDPLLRSRLQQGAGRDLLAHLQSLKAGYGYRAVSILDGQGKALFATDIHPLNDGERLIISEMPLDAPPRLAWSLGEVSSNTVPRVSCLIPIRNSGGEKPDRILVFNLDMETMLASIRRNQPTFRASGETILACRHEDQMVFLSRTRLAQSPMFSVSLTRRELIGVQAILAAEGFFQGQDYRGVPSIAASRKLQSLPWTIFAKMDRSEVTAPLRHLAWIYSGLANLALAAMAFFVVAWWRKNHAHELADRARMQAEKELVDQQLKSLSRHANDIVLLLDAEGRILDANDRALEAYGYSFDQLRALSIKDLRTLDAPGDFSGQFQAAKRSQSIRFEATHVRKDGSFLPVEVSSRSFHQDGNAYVQSIIRDITDRRKAEHQRAMTLEVLAILNRTKDSAEAANLILQVIRQEVGVEAAAIRLAAEGDFTYIAHIGFPADFIQAENCLRARSEQGEPLFDAEGRPLFECTCGMVLAGKSDPENPLFTPGGSVWTNDSRPLLDLPSDLDPRLRPRNRCIHDGYRSVALIPIRSDAQIVGLLQLNDRKGNQFTPELITFLEGIASTIGFTLARKQVEDALRKSEGTFRSLFEMMAQGAFRQRADGTLVDVNPAALRMFGLSRKEFLDRTSEDPAWDVIREDGTPLSAAEHPSLMALRTGEPVFSEMLGVRNLRTGDYVWMEISAIPEFEPGTPTPQQVLVTMHDLTERKQTEEAHHRTEQRFRIVADHTYDWEFWHDDKGRFVYSSPSCERITGYRPEELPDVQALLAIVHAEDVPAFREHLDRSPQGPGGEDIQFRIRHKDGRIRWIGHLCRPIVEAGVYLGVRASNRDITVQHLAQEWLRESEERLRRILQATRVGTWEWHVPTGEVRFNERWAEIIGYTLAELQPLSVKTWRDHLHPDDLKRGEEQLRKNFSRELPYYDIEFRMQHRDGHWVWVQARGQVTEWSQEGQPLIMSGTHTDISVRRNAEDELRTNEAKLDLALRSARMGIWRWDIQADLRYSDDQANRLLGIDPREGFEGSTEGFLQRVLPEDREGVLRAQTRCLVQNQPYECEYRIVWADGSIRFIHSRGQVFRDEEGQPIHLYGVLWDISERKQAEQALKSSEQRYASLFNSIQEGFALHEILTDASGKPRDYRFLDVNPAFEAMTGIPRERWLGHTVLEVLPGLESRWIETYGQVALSGEPTLFESHVAELDRWYQIYAFCPEPRHFAVLMFDVTTKRQAENAMWESEARFQSLVDAAPEPIFVQTRGRFAYVNQAALALFGATSHEELLGQIIQERVHPAFRDIVQERIQGLNIQGQSAAEREVVLLRLDGTPVDVETNGVPVRFKDEPGALVFARNITERKRLQEALVKSERLLREAQEAGHIGCYLLDFRTGIWESSESLNEIFGIDTTYTRSIEGWLELVAPESREELGAYLQELVQARGRFDFDYPIIRKTDGARRWVSGLGELDFDAAGQPLTMIGTIQDITERKETEAEILRMNEELEARVKERTAQLEAANQEMEAFSYSVSHDLRAPLRGIDGFSRALMEDYGDQLDAEGRHCLDRVRHGTQRMGLLIEDMLELSRIGRSELNHRPLDLSGLATQILDELAQRDPDRHVRVTITPGLVANGDLRLLTIALENLLSNAWKYTAKTAEASIHFGAATQDGETQFFVRDNGTGFDMAYAGKLFNAFQRLHASADYEGTGIGLAIVRRVLHRHGGRIWVEAEPGKGATFYFTLPEGEES